MAVSIGNILAHRFPAAPDSAFMTQIGDDGVERIVIWREDLMGRTQPTDAEIESWRLPATKYYQRRTIKRMADISYEGIFSVNGDVMDMYKDRLIIKIARGQALTTTETANRDQMLAIVQSVQDKIAAINNATTVAAVEAVTWP